MSNRTLASKAGTEIVFILRIKAIISKETNERRRKKTTQLCHKWLIETTQRSFHLNRQLIGHSIRIECCAFATKWNNTCRFAPKNFYFTISVVHVLSFRCVYVSRPVIGLCISFIFSLSHAKITHSVRIICLMLNVVHFEHFDTAQKAECHGELESTDILSLICFHLP